MLKITNFAKLAGTTRRTLIFYDQESLFKPISIDEENGYRYYDYDQLYEFKFINGLRQLGLSIEEIKQVLFEKDKDVLDEYLANYQIKLQQEIKQLQVLDNLLEERKTQHHDSFGALPLHTVTTVIQKSEVFWCTDREVDCTPEDIANLYADFVNELGELSAMATGKSGFFTYLSSETPEAYNDAPFRFIKECSSYQAKGFVTKLERKPGRYLSVKVKNTREDIIKGLEQLKSYADKYQLTLSDKLWQINTNQHLVKNAASDEGILQYQILE